MLTISEAITRKNDNVALVPFVTAGYPNLDTTLEVINLLDKKGVNAIELGIPYSDALADGTIIQESSRIALQQNTYIDKILVLLKKVSVSCQTPIIIFTYFNPILARGINQFIKEIADSGVKGLIIPDLPLEEADYLITLCKYYSVELILLISPSSSEQRIHAITAKAPGCIYLVSSYGVTGFRSVFNSNLKDVVQKVKKNTNKRIMLGFGITNQQQVKGLVDLNLNIDAFVIGSAFITQITTCYNERSFKRLQLFCDNIKSAMVNIG